MTSYREQLCPGCYIQHYSSERFGIPDGEHPMGIEFYEDGDAVEAVNQWGEHEWVVGRTVEGNVPWVWCVNDRGEIHGLHPNAVLWGKHG